MKRRLIVVALVLVLAFFIAAPAAYAAQPHMQKALAALKTAKTQLEKAKHDKEGHRAKALELVNEAIKQVQEGIKAGAD